MAEAARDALGLARILFIPAGQPPHKAGWRISPAEDRLAMIEAAIADNPAFAVSRMELDRAGPSYTVDTLQALRHGTGDAAGGDDAGDDAGDGPPDLALILSADAFRGLPTWRDPERVLALATLVVAPREGFPEADDAFLERQFPGVPTARGLSRWSATASLGLGPAVEGAGRSLTALPRARCGRGLYRRP
ncbi:MAG: nicotinate-nicotinamide nucleotide adenylyltransferase [Candidatus Limnocylindrales bacterium]